MFSCRNWVETKMCGVAIAVYVFYGCIYDRN